MKRYLVLIFYSGCAFAFGQQPLLMPMVSSNSCGVKIINVSELNGDSVAVFFKADQKNAAGATIGIENMLVTEGGKKCGIISFQTIKKIAPIKLAVVIDYSSSTGGGRSFFHKFFANLDLLQEEEDTFTDIPFKKKCFELSCPFFKISRSGFFNGYSPCCMRAGFFKNCHN